MWCEAPDGIVAFHREVKGNKVIVLANFGIPAGPAEVETTDGNSNRPDGAKAAEPFLNLKNGELYSPTIKLDGEYTDVFTGTVMSGENTITIAPGEFLVLSKR